MSNQTREELIKKLRLAHMRPEKEAIELLASACLFILEDKSQSPGHSGPHAMARNAMDMHRE